MDGVGWNYSDVVKEHFMRPKNILQVSEEEYKADGVGFVGSPACGDMMKIFIKVKEGRIIDLKWQTFGCASAIGSTSMLSEMVTRDGGMTLEEAIEITPEAIIKELGGLPANKIHCSVLGDKALRDAINDYYKKTGQTDKIPKTEAKIVCECLEVTDEDIRMEVLEGVKDFDTLQKRTKVGTGCGKCADNVKKILNDFVEQYYKCSIYTGEK
ncbi:MAG TPA: iron-sulfur cluster assembly scaffold protein [Spirochaetota bacterium]|nr:iron-sulfur cluster assembly scaffold protein [Spirochaetota bacterium]HOS32018.1 iron-sulfur cluster assembly scaffold protein [Spirochaetota bacterium]HOS55002.1 iron-sulfur cluster assembly scaffold protein [Spirochaetota bacterium]HPK61302.1 iron-sulfur cluster assembly scaffold protein [Spirochaetota bacterium]HQF77581.1 iron-sulfur cluster assembly scaffold protein [Spirochaetota bacterium]